MHNAVQRRLKAASLIQSLWGSCLEAPAHREAPRQLSLPSKQVIKDSCWHVPAQKTNS